MTTRPWRSSAIALLGAAIDRPTHWWPEVARLPRDAWTPAERVVLDAAARAHRAGRLSTPTVIDALPDADPEVASLLRAPPRGEDAVQAALSLVRDQHQGAVVQTAPELVRDALAESAGLEPTAVLSAIRAAIDRLTEQCFAGSQSSVEHVADVATRWASEDTAPPPRLRTPWPSVDAELHGFRSGELVLLGAATAGGKSLAALQLADHWADAEDAPTLYCGLEMSTAETFERLLSRRTGIPADKLAARAYSADESVAVTREARLLATRRPPLYFFDRPLTVAGLREIARQHHARHGLRALVVDYLQLVQPDRASHSRERDVSTIAYGLKALAQELGLVVLAPVQLSRAHNARADSRPALHDLRESGALEQAANRVLLLHRPARYDDTADPRLIELAIAKQRSGRDGTIISLRWDPEMSAISDHRWSRA